MTKPANQKLHEAMLTAARSMIAVDDFHEKLLDGVREMKAAARGRPLPEDEEEQADSSDFSDEDAAELERLNADYERVMDTLAADPELRAEMECWMVDFEGTEQPPGTGDGNIDAMTEEQREAAQRADFGVMPRVVRKWITSHGFRITDSHSGVSGWGLGVPCGDTDSLRLCRLAQRELGHHITDGRLAVQIHFWGWRFAAVTTVEQARAFLRKREVS